MDPKTVLRIFTSALDELVLRPSSASRFTKQMLHLLLELLPGAARRCPDGPAGVGKEAARLLLNCCRTGQARVAAKVPPCSCAPLPMSSGKVGNPPR